MWPEYTTSSNKYLLLNTAALSGGDGVRNTSDGNAFESMRAFWADIRASARYIRLRQQTRPTDVNDGACLANIE